MSERPFSEQLGKQLGGTESTTTAPPATGSGEGYCLSTTVDALFVVEGRPTRGQAVYEKDSAYTRITFMEWGTTKVVFSALLATNCSPSSPAEEHECSTSPPCGEDSGDSSESARRAR